MAVTYGFYNSVGGDRKYDAVQMSKLFDGILNDGVYPSVGTALTVEASEGMNINVGPGRAWFNRTWTDNDAVLPLTVETAEVALKRIDAVVIEVNTDPMVRANTIKVIKGLPSSTPVKPEMVKSETTNQYALAYITLNAGAASITQSDIEIVVGSDETPFVSGILETISIEGITALLTYEWDQWFENIKEQLDGDVAGNLQNQINNLNVLTGVGPPLETTKGVVGQFYLNLESKKLYQCTDFNVVYIWTTINGDRVGTIKQSVCTDPGADWLLCNGDTFDVNTYPELANCPALGHNLKHNTVQSSLIEYEFGPGVSPRTVSWKKHYRNLGGYDILVGFNSPATAHYKFYVGYCRHGEITPMKIKEIYSNTNLASYQMFICGCTYDGEKWIVAIGGRIGTMSKTMVIRSAVSLDGPWGSHTSPPLTQWEIISEGLYKRTSGIISANDYLVVLSDNFDNENAIYSGWVYYKHKTDSAWSKTQLPGATSQTVRGVLYYENNTWFILCSNGLFYCTSSTPNAWVKSTTFPGNRNLFFQDNKILYIIHTHGDYSLTLGSSEFSVNPSFKTKQIELTSNVAGKYTSLSFDGDHWYIFYTTYQSLVVLQSENSNFDSNYTEIPINIWYSEYLETDKYKVFSELMDAWFDPIAKRHIIISDRGANRFHVRLRCGAALPIISSANVYTYIKAKGDD